MIRYLFLALSGAAVLAPSAQAQDMDHSHHKLPISSQDDRNVCVANQAIQRWSNGSGSSRLPGNESTMGSGCTDAASSHTPGGLHTMSGEWMLMAHGFVSAQYTDHSGPRGDDKLYATSMAMLTGARKTSWGRIQLKSMLSLEPAMDAAGYPNLFASGETANGDALVDRQHPHDLFMELAVRVDFNIGEGTTAFLYGGPVAEPALGPSAFMHRNSADVNPEPPITHHWFDSTHITYGVVTAGISAPRWQIETSAFRGAEPDEERWGIESPKLDSWSVRGTYNPAPRWLLQASYGDIKEPEALHPGEGEKRFTASAHYSTPGLSAMLAFSAKNRVPGPTLTAWLAEANWNIDQHNTLFSRIENVRNDEFFPDHDDPLHDESFRMTKFQAGYARRIRLDPFSLALGGSLSTYAKPNALDAAYGGSPWGYTVFTKLSLGH